MAKKENYRVHSNGITAEIPKVCNVMSFGRGRVTEVTNSAERGIVNWTSTMGNFNYSASFAIYCSKKCCYGTVKKQSKYRFPKQIFSSI